MSGFIESDVEPDWSTTTGPFFISGEAADLPSIARICVALPPEARGMVAVEVAVPLQIRPIVAPDGVQVSWLVRADGITARMRGARLAFAFEAWNAEWACGAQRDRRMIWLGAHTPFHAVRIVRSLLAARSPAVRIVSPSPDRP